LTDVLPNRRVLLLVLAFVILAVFPYLYTWPFFSSFLGPFRTFQAMRFAIWLIVLMGLNLLTGYSGQISLGHGAFIAIGAYIAAILMNTFSVPVFAAVLAAGLLAGLIGFLLGIPALRLSGPYLAIATLALVIVLPNILKHHLVEDWTGGTMGISLSTSHVPASLKGRATDYQWLYYNCMVPAVIMTAMAWSLTRSRVGRALVALRDSKLGAQQMGIDVSLYKMTAFGLCALYAGTGGALYVYTAGYLGPATFDIGISFVVVIMIVLGGLASIAGTIFAAIMMTVRIDFVNFVVSIIPFGEKIGIDRSRDALFGALLIWAIIFTPTGIAGSIRERRERREARRVTGASALPPRLAQLFRRKEPSLDSPGPPRVQEGKPGAGEPTGGGGDERRL
jgi:branched-chain amino acid transport system permease protein